MSAAFIVLAVIGFLFVRSFGGVRSAGEFSRKKGS